jgi:hypothetical protein
MVKKGIASIISKFMKERVGINNLATVPEIAYNTSLKPKVVEWSMREAKKKMRKSGLFLRNGRVWIDKEMNWFTKRPKGIKCTRKSGYYVVRLDKSHDI